MKRVALAALFTILSVVEQANVGASKHGAVAKVPIAVFFTASPSSLPAPENVLVDALSPTEFRVLWSHPGFPELNITEACSLPTTVTSSLSSTSATTTDIDTDTSTVRARDDGRIVVDQKETSTSELPHLEFEVAWEGPDGTVSSHRTLECQYVVGGLTPATNYSVVVRALYEGLESEPSDTVVAQTMTSPPPSNLPLILGIGIPFGLAILMAAGWFVYKIYFRKSGAEKPTQRPEIRLATPEETQEQRLRKEYQELFGNKELIKPRDTALRFPHKNRFTDVLPYDDTLVCVQNVDYINASYILDRNFIAAQDPMPDQGDDFWQLIWECDVRVIVRLSTDLPNQSVAIYVKEAGEGRWIMGHDELEVTVTTQNSVGTLLKKTLEVSKGETQRTIHFYHMTGWTNDALPTPKDLVNLILVGRSSRQMLGPRTPVLVHCSAGSGRTGTLIAAWHMIDQESRGSLSNLVRVVNAMREDRVSLVQSEEQYALVYQTVEEWKRTKAWQDSEGIYDSV